MTKETTYEFILRIENNMDFAIMLKKGLLPISVLSKKVYYEYYKQERKAHPKMQSITNTSEEFGVADMTVRRAIKMMEE